ncbi:protein of unknown function [Fulvimarina manganoxydans]|uniref:DUF922 domain-containing protein n=1 Tax=Fulvimarina manganoxydans TaxID=937218 RepID=A0A1W2BZ07_9HYPH|nr:protein of unknown function [Fulvimarina manganoxydans]
MRLRRNCLWALMPLGAMALSALATQTSAQEPVTQPRAVVPEAAVGTTQSDQGPDGTINVRTDTYQVTGSSYKDLWSSVQRAAMENGPEMGIGEASISFQPRANFEEGQGGCVASDVAVDMNAVLTFPEWHHTGEAAANATAAFDRMLAYLRVHEAQHVEIAREYRAKMIDAIKTLPAATSCEGMRAAVQKAALAINALHQKAQRRYDVEQRKMSTELFGREG